MNRSNLNTNPPGAQVFNNGLWYKKGIREQLFMWVNGACIKSNRCPADVIGVNHG